METKTELVQFDALKADIALFVQPVMSLTVSDDESAKKALEVAKEVKFYSKKAEELRTSLVGPLNERVKKINAYAKGLTEPLNQAEAHLKNHLAKWSAHLEQIRIKKMQEAEAERRRQEEEAAKRMEEQRKAAEMEALFKEETEIKRDEIVQTVEAERVAAEIHQAHRDNVREIESIKVSGARKVWTFRITCESDVPREFLVIDETIIRKAINAGMRDIPGVEIFQETKVAIR